MRFDARLLVRLYPRQWRERYGAELIALLEDSRLSGARVALDVSIGALREHLRAAFVSVSPKRRQSALRTFATIISWAAGAAAGAAVALALPDTGKGSVTQSAMLLVAALGVVVLFFYMPAVSRGPRAGLAAGVPLLRPAFAVFAILLALAVTALADLPAAHAFRAGQSTLAELFQSSVGRAIAFGPVGRGLAAMFWPDEFRDLNPPSQSSTLGLGA